MGFTAKLERGFSVLGLVSPKTGENVGGAMRAAHCYGCAQVRIENARTGVLRHATNTPRAERVIPTYFDEDVLATIPHDTQVVVVDIIPGAKPLHKFEHPERAIYLFGPEDGTLGKRHTERAQHVVYVPTRNCMNLAACVNVVLYDRWAKRQREARA